MNHAEIVKKLIGNIRPAADASIDSERFENLKAMCKLVDELVGEIDSVAVDFKDRQEHSVKQMSSYADNFLTNL